MSEAFSPCPHLPACRDGLDWKALNSFEKDDRGPEFYYACLEYGQSLWTRGFAARAILCLDRAFAADLTGDELILTQWPLPYSAMAWLLDHVPDGTFMGNPRVHFQHYADRMNEPRKHQRQWRAWACWAIARAVLPDLPADPKHHVVEPDDAAIDTRLRACGIAGEAELWARVLAEARKGR
jgi:hypothetical protein